MDNTYAVDSHAVIVLLFFKKNTKNPLVELSMLVSLTYMMHRFNLEILSSRIFNHLSDFTCNIFSFFIKFNYIRTSFCIRITGSIVVMLM